MSQQTNDPNSNLQRRAHRTTNQRIWNIENQFLTGGVSLKDIARGVVINSQMIDNLRQNPGVTQEQKVTYKRQDNQQSNIQSEVIKLSALSDIDYYDDTGTQQTTGASVKVNRITTTTDTTGNLFVITNDGKVIMYNKRTNPAIVYDLTSNDVLTFRNDTNQVKLRFNRVDGKITASVLESSQCDIINGGYLNFLSGSTNYYRMYRDGTDLKLNSDTNGTIYTISNTGVITATNHINTSGNIVADGTITANGGFTTSTSMSTDGNITAQGFVQVGDDLRVSGNAGFGMTPTYKVDVNGSARISTALGIGTAPDGSNPLKVEGNTLINGNLRVSSGTQMDGNVGIGGAADGTSTLRVVGDALIDGDSAGSANLKLKKNGQSEQSVVRMDNSGQIYIGSSVSGKHTFIDAGGSTSIMVDGSTNNVGIGGNPSYLMDVAGSGRVQTALGIATAPNGSIPLVVNGKTHLQSNTGIGVAPDSTHDLLVNGSTRLSGNVGVGTAATSNEFEVSGSGKFTQYIGVGGADPNASYPLHVTGNSKLNGRVGVNGDPDSTHALQVNGSANIYNSASGDAELWFKSGTETNKTIVMQNDGDVYFQSTDATAYLRGNSGIRFETDTGSGFAEHMIITQAGNVGIGTGYTPNYILDTKDNVRFGLAAAYSQLAIGGGNNFKSIANTEAGIANANDTVTQYAIKQNTSGQTELNAQGGQAMIFNINDSQQMILDSNGNFGIGTTSPQQTLHIQNTSAQNQTLNTEIILQSYDSRFARGCGVISSVHEGPSGCGTGLLFKTRQDSGSNFNPFDLIYERMRITNTGNVGIGTTNPDEKLEVNGNAIIKNSSGEVRFTLASSEEDQNTSLFFSTPNSSGIIPGGAKAKAAIIAEALDFWSQSKLHICMDNSQGSSPGSHTVEASIANATVTFMNNGNMGIGTTDPDEKLEVDSGNILIYPVATPTYTPSSGNYIRSHLLNTNESILDIIGNGQTLRLNSGNTPWIGTETNHPFRLATNGIEHLRIDTSGNVGIGTSTITGGYKLDVNGSQVIRDNLYVQDNIGIGTSSPGAKLEVQSGTSATEIRVGNTSFTDALVRCLGNSMILGLGYGDSENAGSSNTTTLVLRGPGGIYFDTYTSGRYPTTKAILDTTGNFGIGTTSPQYPLDVASSKNASIYIDRYFGGGPGTGVADQNGNISTDWSAYFAFRVLSQYGFYITSDKRIKKNINEINDSLALQKIRQLKPCTYNYIDSISRGTDNVIGYIAQEVAEVIPEAVDNTTTQFIPSIYHNSTCSITSPTEITIDYNDISNISLEDSIKFYLPNVSNELIGNVSTISSDSFTLTLDSNITTQNNVSLESITEAFMYGKQVNNLNTLKKEYIFTVATAALQELDRDHENTKAELATTKQELATANQKIDLLLQRMEALEKQVNSA